MTIKQHLDAATSPHERIRIQSCSNPRAAVWLMTSPKSLQCTMSDLEFTVAVRNRFNLHPFRNTPNMCECGITLTGPSAPSHVHWCKSMHQKQTTDRHDYVVRCLADIGRAAGLMVRVEERDTAVLQPSKTSSHVPSSGAVMPIVATDAVTAATSVPCNDAKDVKQRIERTERKTNVVVDTDADDNEPDNDHVRDNKRPDIIMYGPTSVRLIDVSILHPLSPSYVKSFRPQHNSQSLIVKRECHQKLKYADLAKATDCGRVSPFVIDAFSAVGADAIELLDWLGNLAVATP